MVREYNRLLWPKTAYIRACDLLNIREPDPHSLTTTLAYTYVIRPVLILYTYTTKYCAQEASRKTRDEMLDDLSEVI